MVCAKLNGFLSQDQSSSLAEIELVGSVDDLTQPHVSPVLGLHFCSLPTLRTHHLDRNCVSPICVPTVFGHRILQLVHKLLVVIFTVAQRALFLGCSTDQNSEAVVEAAHAAQTQKNQIHLRDKPLYQIWECWVKSISWRQRRLEASGIRGQIGFLCN